MNTQAIARALRLLADAIETPASPPLHLPPTAPSNVATAAPSAEAPKRGPGRPPKAAPTGASAPAATPVASTPATTPTSSALPAPASGPTGLTHAIVANDFKAAALAHGRDFVKGLLTAHGAPTFDKVKDLATFREQLRAGPQAAPVGAADDLLG